MKKTVTLDGGDWDGQERTVEVAEDGTFEIDGMSFPPMTKFVKSRNLDYTPVKQKYRISPTNPKVAEFEGEEL